MKPVVTIEEMRAIDATASVGESELIYRAAWAVSRAAIRMMGGTYGRRVVVVAGPGNNGADGRRAAGFLEDRGVHTTVHLPGDFSVVPDCDLVIDAAFGTGFRGSYVAPDPNGALVLAVDIPSGVHGNTGIACDGAVWADHTVTFAALKPGHLLKDGPDHSGEIELCDIGLDVSSARMHLFEAGDLDWILPSRSRDAHKWKSALGVVAGSPGMMGAAHLVVLAAQRAGVGMVRVLSPGVSFEDALVSEAVAVDGTEEQWSKTIIAMAGRLHAVVAGPGLGRTDNTGRQLRSLVSSVDCALVIDADGIVVLADEEGRSALCERTSATVLTPHDGEFRALCGHMPEDERYDEVRRLASILNSVILLKGPTTVVASPGGGVLFVTSGDSRLATAGTGDVLAGIVGAFLAQNVDAHLAAAAGAYVHGIAAKNSYACGLIASDLPENVAKLLSMQSFGSPS